MLRVFAFDGELLIAAEVCVYALAAWWLARRSPRGSDWLLLVFLVGAAALAVGHLAKFGQSVLTMYYTWARSEWYFVPAYLMTALIVPIRCYAAIYLIRRFIEPRWRSAARALSAAAVGVSLLLLLPYEFPPSLPGELSPC